MISDGSFEVENWSNGCKKKTALSFEYYILKYIQIEIRHFKM